VKSARWQKGGVGSEQAGPRKEVILFFSPPYSRVSGVAACPSPLPRDATVQLSGEKQESKVRVPLAVLRLERPFHVVSRNGCLRFGACSSGALLLSVPLLSPLCKLGLRVGLRG